jgi:predicted Zn-dependent peptidase
MPPHYQVTRLESGLTVATVAMPDRASVSVGLWVATGGRYESEADNGVCHFIEHMLFKGTRRRTAREISQAVEGIGGYLNAFTGEESTCFYARASHDHLPELLDVLSDMLLHPRLAPDDVDRERNVIKEELAMYLDQPQHHVQELLNATLWPGQPLGRPLTGTPASLDRLGRAELLAFKHANYVAPATFLVAAGHVQHERLVRLVRNRLRGLRSGIRPIPQPAIEHQTAPGTRLCSKETEQTQLALGIRACSRHDPRRYPLRLLNTLLGENMSSCLFQVVREEQGLAYSIYSSVAAFADTGVMVISAGLDTANVRRALPLILRELSRLASQPPGQAEFRRARDYVLGQMDLGLENTENQMQWTGEQLIGHGRLIPASTVRRRLAAVTPAEIMATARDFFRADRMNLALVSPLKSGVALHRMLRRFSPGS